MITRRSTLKIGGMAALMAPFAGFGATSAGAQAGPPTACGSCLKPSPP